MSGFDIFGPEGIRHPRLLGETVLQQEGTGTADAAGDLDFKEVLEDALHKVSGLSHEARDKAEALARGEPVEVHDLMIAMGKSEVAFNLMLEVRNKILEAWQVLQRSVT